MLCLKPKAEWLAETYGETSAEMSDYYADDLNRHEVCGLEDEHEGPHDFVGGDEIAFVFKESPGG